MVSGRRDEEERWWTDKGGAGSEHPQANRKHLWLDLRSTPYTEINSKEATDLNVKATMTKLSERKGKLRPVGASHEQPLQHNLAEDGVGSLAKNLYSLTNTLGRCPGPGLPVLNFWEEVHLLMEPTAWLEVCVFVCLNKHCFILSVTL